MNIKDERKETKTFYFIDIDFGRAFEYAEKIYLKISSYEAFNLHDNAIVEFTPSAPIIPLNAEIIIKE